MANAGWKTVERRIAKMLEGERVPLSGSNWGTPGDVVTGEYLVEVKSRKDSLINKWFNKIRGESRGVGKKPLLVVQDKGRNDYIVCMDIREFQRLKGIDKRGKNGR